MDHSVNQYGSPISPRPRRRSGSNPRRLRRAGPARDRRDDRHCERPFFERSPSPLRRSRSEEEIDRHQLGLAVAGLFLLGVAALVVAYIVAAVCVRNVAPSRCAQPCRARARRDDLLAGRLCWLVLHPLRELRSTAPGLEPSFGAPVSRVPRRTGAPGGPADSSTSAARRLVGMLSRGWCRFAVQATGRLPRCIRRVRPRGDVLRGVAAIACFRLMRGIASRQEAIAARFARQ